MCALQCATLPERKRERESQHLGLIEPGVQCTVTACAWSVGAASVSMRVCVQHVFVYDVCMMYVRVYMCVCVCVLYVCVCVCVRVCVTL